MIEIPDTTVNKGIVFVKGRWYAYYWEDGKQKRAVTLAVTKEEAIKARDAFYGALVRNRKATVRRRKKPSEKLEKKPDLFVYARDPYFVFYEGKIIATAKTRKAAREARDKFLLESGL